MTDREAYIVLNAMEGVGPVTVASLASRLGSVAAILQAGEGDLLGARGVGAEIASRICGRRAEIDPAAEEEKASRLGARIITPADGDYPRSLREIHDPPLALYVRGGTGGLAGRAVSVVGTRRASRYGADMAECLSHQLAQAGFVVVSGLARGIDTAAHQGALKAGGRTVAVLGSGLGCLYPAENAALAGRIAEKGAVLSEFTPGRKPDRTTFAIRNRIVSGLSMGVIVVEADMHSGAMITAREASEQGRTVFAVPGRADSPLSRGPHDLLRNGARLVEDAEDVIEEFEFLIPPAVSGGNCRSGSAPRLSPDERKIADALSAYALDVDSIIRQTGLDAGKVSSLLIGLEMKRVARMLPGRMVELVARRPVPAATDGPSTG